MLFLCNLVRNIGIAILIKALKKLLRSINYVLTILSSEAVRTFLYYQQFASRSLKRSTISIPALLYLLMR